MRHVLLASAALAAIGAAIGAGAGQAVAQERIIVTTQKRAQQLIDVPINVSAFDSSTLEELAITRFDTLSDYTPGLQIQLQSPNNPSFSIRGISTDDTASNVETRVSIFQDGVSASKAGGSVFELFDIERIEVAKGPQSTLFGRAALIGAINVIQAKPMAGAFGGGATLEGGEDGYHRIEGYVNAPIIDDTLAVRIAGVDTERDGYVENLLGDPLNARDTQALRGTVSFTPSSSLSVDLIANWQEDNPSGTAFKSGVIAPPGGDVSPFSPAALNTFGGFAGGRDLGVERTLSSYTGIVSWEISDALTVTSVSGFREFDSSEIFDPDGSALEFLVAESDSEGEQVSQELRLNFDGPGRIDAFGGVNYFREYGSRYNLFATNEAVAQQLNLSSILAAGGFPSVGAAENAIARGVLINALVSQGVPLAAAAQQVGGLPLGVVNAQLAGLPVSPPLGPVDLDNPLNPYPYSVFGLAGGQILPLGFYQEGITDTAETTSWDVFGDVTVHVTDKLDVIGGLRYTEDSKRASAYNTLFSQNKVAPTPTLFLPVTFSPTGGPGAPVSAAGDFDGLAWRLVGSYRINDATNVWASVARGRRPEVLNVQSTVVDSTPGAPGGEFDALTTPEVIAEEIVDSVEVGGYAELMDGAVVLQGSAFYFEYQDFQLAFLNQGRFEVVNGGDASGPGVEGSLAWTVNDFASVFANYAYNGVRFDGGSGDTAALGLDLDDARFRLAPDHELTVGGRLSRPVGSLGEAFFVPSYVYQSEVLFENGDPDFDLPGGGSIPLSQDAYGVLNLRLGLEDSARRWSVELFAQNALDEEFIIDAGNTGLSFGSPTYVRGAPRMVGVSLTGRF